jgi:hypothetical protein
MGDFQSLIWESFVIRLWREAISGTWRGQIVHLPDRETAHFVTLEQATAFIGRFADGLEDQTSSMNQDEADSSHED